MKPGALFWIQGCKFQKQGQNLCHQGRNIEVRGAILGPPGAGFFNYVSPGVWTCQLMHSGQYLGTIPSCASTLHVGKNFGMSASCRVADTSYRSMQAPVQYILFLSNSFVCTYVFGYEKGTFSFNQCTYTWPV